MSYFKKSIWRSYENFDLQNFKEGHGYVYVPPEIESNLYIIYFHGTNGDVTKAITRMSPIQHHKIFIEYPGYSDFSRSLILTAESLQEDIQVTLQKVFNFIPTSKSVVLYGRSIGTGVMCPYIKNYSQRIQGIILENPFLSLEDIFYSYIGVLSNFLNTGWNLATNEHIKNLNIPVLVLAGEQDMITPISHAKYIFEESVSSDVQLITYCHQAHSIKFKKLKEDVDKWLKELFFQKI